MLIIINHLRRKSVFYAGALAMLLSSCSNDDVATGPVVEGGNAAVQSLKVSLVSGADTKSTTEGGVGSENKLIDSYIFVQCDDDGPDANTQNYVYEYKCVPLTGGQSSAVVKWVKPSSKVYVVSNAPYMDEATTGAIVNAANAGDVDAVFQAIDPEVEKDYLVGLNSTNGRFMMTGVGVVPPAAGNGASVLSVGLKRDLAKVDFKVKKEGTSTTSGVKVEVVEVQEVTIRRAANKVEPFAMKDGVPTTFVLPFGYGDVGYVQDGLAANGTFAPSNDQTTNGATDYSLIYDGNSISTSGDSHALKAVYVLPNAAQTAEKGTIIVVKAKVKVTTPAADGNSNPTVAETTKYYKARVSSGLDAYGTGQNAKYSITATIKGEGGSNDNTGQDGPDVENTENDLNIDVKVEPWNLIISNQEIG